MASSTPKHILFVDDDPIYRHFFAAVLRAGMPAARSTGAADVEQALEVLAREPIDLVITDIDMPGTGGIEEVLQLARRRMPIPVLVVTAHASPANETGALSGGAIEIFGKPIHPALFLRRVRDLLAEGIERAPGSCLRPASCGPVTA